jgi:hypothetical protein
METRKASENGLKQIKDALSQRGYKSPTNWETFAYMEQKIELLKAEIPGIKFSYPTWRRFLGRKTDNWIQLPTVEAICRVLNCKVNDIIRDEEPPVSDNFTGRDRDLEKLERWVGRDLKCRLINLYGFPGIGKKTLVTQLKKRFLDIQYVRIEFYLGKPLDELLKTLNIELAKVNLANNETSSQPPKDILWKYLSKKRHLIVLEEKLPKNGESSYLKEYTDFFYSLTEPHLGIYQKSCILLVTECRLPEIGTRIPDDSFQSLELKQLKIDEREKLLEKIFKNATSEVTQDERFINELAQKTGYPVWLKSMAASIVRHYNGNIEEYLENQAEELCLPEYLEQELHRCLEDLSDGCWVILTILANAKPMTKRSIQTCFYDKYGQSSNAFNKAFNDIKRRPLLSYDRKNSLYGLEEIIKPLICNHHKFNQN